MKSHRSYTYRKHWKQLIKVYGAECYYCDKEVATVIDHIVPVAAGGSDSFDNLVPSCAFCNLIVSDKVFDTLDDKRRYIIKERNKKNKRRRCLCIECCIPYEYRYHSPSVLLCAECYDNEYGDTNYSKSIKWERWLETLMLAGHSIEAYRRVGQASRRVPMEIGDRYRILWNIIEETLDDERVSIS